MQQVSFEIAKNTLAPALKGGAGVIKREIKQGVASVYQSSNKNVFAVVRPEGKELVFVAVAGKNLASAVNEFVLFAKQRGFSSVRYHTKNPYFVAKGVSALAIKPQLIEVRKAIFGNDEYIYRVNL
ncbi:hypothetical protein CWB76_10195 [Pseudoalteromonas sp. S1609]|uniref:hypothetical protein n=1 Tax=Pseudoalteromonas sp. S1609 TaxID=579505 RepID=UPI00110A5D66|nr:hypothetical protein [Pseudoalteromonas sp. S1609]TMP70541.1 hypothetical protein CWB76_10195 [Pseudoalteromonas sp. S1609]